MALFVARSLSLSLSLSRSLSPALRPSLLLRLSGSTGSFKILKEDVAGGAPCLLYRILIRSQGARRDITKTIGFGCISVGSGLDRAWIGLGSGMETFQNHWFYLHLAWIGLGSGLDRTWIRIGNLTNTICFITISAE